MVSALVPGASGPGQPNKLRGNDLRWTRFLSRGSTNTPSRFMLQKPGISCGSYGPLGSKGFIYLCSYKRLVLSYFRLMHPQSSGWTRTFLLARKSKRFMKKS